MVPESLLDTFVPAFPGIPGGVELLVILLITVLVFGLPLVLLLGAVFLGWNVLGSRGERVEELEERVEELERELQQERSGRDERDSRE